MKFPSQLGFGVRECIAPVAGGNLGHIAFAEESGVQPAAGLEGGHGNRVGAQGGHGVGVGLQGHGLGCFAHGRSPETEDQRGVDLAALDLDPGFVERPGSVHFDVAFHDRGPRADGIDVRHRLVEIDREPVAHRCRARGIADPDIAPQCGAALAVDDDEVQQAVEVEVPLDPYQEYMTSALRTTGGAAAMLTLGSGVAPPILTASPSSTK